ncbi:unnamed protein product [Phytomonas sp. Hart1]|nr:unnamed protein product [Phytomonas sp. Hart1]|eukprot:CCW67881.1 unnamed protein product [Phytomonas sp. isolate Hart1]
MLKESNKPLASLSTDASLETTRTQPQLVNGYSYTRSLHSTLRDHQRVDRIRNHVTTKRNRTTNAATTASISSDNNLKAEGTNEEVCTECRKRYYATTEAIELYRQLFVRAKDTLLQDVVHHHSNDELWVRLCRALDESSNMEAMTN